MANNCYYRMMIRGRREDCGKWIRRMESPEEPNGFHRIFSAIVYDERGDDNDFSAMIEGDCAWSLESCCRASGYSGGIDLFAVNSKELNIVMEAYSQEVGCEFQEHYIYDKGNCLVDECEFWSSTYYDESEFESFEAFKECVGAPCEFTKDDLDEDGCYTIGGFGEWDFSIPQAAAPEPSLVTDNFPKVEIADYLLDD